jgi:hypothetical protein
MATNELTKYIKSHKCRGFNARPYYSPEGDFLAYYFKDADFYAERVDSILTVYKAMEGGEFIGFKLKSVNRLLDILAHDYAFEVPVGASIGACVDHEGTFRLSILFLVGIAETDYSPAKPIYKDFANRTRNVHLKRQELRPSMAEEGSGEECLFHSCPT